MLFCRAKDDRQRQEKLGKDRLFQRKGRKLPRDWKGEDFKFAPVGEAGLVDVFEDTVRALERKQAMEREFLIYLLQGRESTQARSAARKLSAGNCKCVKNVKILFMLQSRLCMLALIGHAPQD